VDFEQTLHALLAYIGREVVVMVTSISLDPILIAHLEGSLETGDATTFGAGSTDEALTFRLGPAKTHFFLHKNRFRSAVRNGGELMVTTDDAVFRVWPRE
jgi:hypothetical protein